MKAELNSIYTDLRMLEDGSWIPDYISINATLENVEKIAVALDIKLEDTREITPNYKKGYEEVMCYFDSISEEEQLKLLEELKKLGL